LMRDDDDVYRNANKHFIESVVGQVFKDIEKKGFQFGTVDSVDALQVQRRRQDLQSISHNSIELDNIAREGEGSTSQKSVDESSVDLLAPSQTGEKTQRRPGQFS